MAVLHSLKCLLLGGNFVEVEVAEYQCWRLQYETLTCCLLQVEHGGWERLEV